MSNDTSARVIIRVIVSEKGVDLVSSEQEIRAGNTPPQIDEIRLSASQRQLIVNFTLTDLESDPLDLSVDLW